MKETYSISLTVTDMLLKQGLKEIQNVNCKINKNDIVFMQLTVWLFAHCLFLHLIPSSNSKQPSPTMKSPRDQNTSFSATSASQ